MSIQLIRNRGAPAASSKGCVAAVGNFDGVHCGHQILLKRLKAQAEALGLPSLVLTFEPQPGEFFKLAKPVPRLTRLREKLYYLSQADVDKAWVLHFDAALAALTAEEFVHQVLCQQLRVKHLIIGEDFRFGHKRQGDVNLLKKMGQAHGFVVEVMPDVLLEGERVSSTRVREALGVADQALAERLLGRPYCMFGRVVYGSQLGRQLGFPTANIDLHRQETPVKGIYAVRLYGLSGNGLPGVANVGTRPTVGGTRILLEVHLFDFEQTIYGKHVRVEFCKKLREEERFDSLDLLKKQMERDAVQAREYFAGIL